MKTFTEKDLNEKFIGTSVIFLATAKALSRSKDFDSSLDLDTNDKEPVLLDPYAGNSPRGINVVAGTVAESQGFTKGQMHMVKATYMGVAESNRAGSEGRKTHSFNYALVKGDIDVFEDNVMKWADDRPLNVILPMEPNEEPVIETNEAIETEA